MKYIGFIKYNGKDIVDGVFDARQASEALVGFDNTLRYFLSKEDSIFKDLEFTLPVKIEEGSWGIFTPENIENLIYVAGGTTLATCTLKSYLSETAKKAANDGLMSTGMVKDIKSFFLNAYKAATYTVKLASHLGKLKTKLEKVKVIGNEAYITNDFGKVLLCPVKFLEIFQNCPELLFSQLVSVVSDRHELEIGFIEADKTISAKVTTECKDIFYKENKIDDIILPELKHDQFVELEGVIVRCNEVENTIGFKYKDHTITGKPHKGKITDYKNKIISQTDDHIYPPVRIIGIIDRRDNNGKVKQKRPRIIFEDIHILEEKSYIIPDLFT